ncbi:hypothetical protein ES702_05983 [subsurface metagenome]
MKKTKPTPDEEIKDMELPYIKIQRLEISEGELKDFIDSKIDFIEGKIFEKDKLPDRNFTLFDMSKIEKQKYTDSPVNQNIMIERNLLEVPIANYSDKTKTNWIIFENKDKSIITKTGTPDGALTGFDERVLWGEVTYKFKFYVRNNKVCLVSAFTTYDTMKDLNLAKSGAVRQKVNSSIEKLGKVLINYKKFNIKSEKSNKIIELSEDYPLFKYRGSVKVKDEERERSYHVFILNDMFSYNLINQYLKYVSRKRYIKITDDLTRRIWIYLSCKMGKEEKYQEGIDTFLNRVGITDERKDHAIERLKEKLTRLKEKGDIEKYFISKNKILTIYRAKGNIELTERIIDWLYGDCFNGWVKALEVKMKNKFNTLIRNYGSKRIEGLFNDYANAYNSHPKHFLKVIKELEQEEPITDKLTHKDIQKLKKKAGI